MNNLRNRGVLSHVLLKVVPSSCVALLILWLFVGFAGERLLNARSMETLKLAADQQSLIVANKLDDLMERLGDISGNALTINAFIDPASVEHFLEPFFRSLRFGDHDSLTIAMVDFSGQIIASNRESGILEQALAKGRWHDIIVSEKEVLTIVDGSLVASVPIRVGAFPEGVITIRLSPQDTRRLLSSDKHEADVWLWSQDGQRLFGPASGERSDDGTAVEAGDGVTSAEIAPRHLPTLIVTSTVPIREQDHLIGLLHRFLFVAFLLDLAALTLGIYVAANLVARPLNRLIEKIRSLEEMSNPEARLEPEGPRELSNLARAFNKAADRQADLMNRLEKALDAEKEVNGLQRQFVALVSHEFRTPLAIIDGNSQRILRRIEEMPRDRIGSGLEKCRASVRRLVDLMESILSSSRLEAGTIAFKPKQFHLVDLVQEAIDIQQEISGSHEIITDIDRLPSHISGDPKLLHQAFTNLLSNAVKYSPGAPKIWIEGRLEDHMAVISVRDQGLGIPDEELKKLFGRFFRASTATGIPGTGIGLHLVKSLIEMHEGDILVESAEGEGSTFTVKLPVGLPSDRQKAAA